MAAFDVVPWDAVLFGGAAPTAAAWVPGPFTEAPSLTGAVPWWGAAEPFAAAGTARAISGSPGGAASAGMVAGVGMVVVVVVVGPVVARLAGAAVLVAACALFAELMAAPFLTADALVGAVRSPGANGSRSLVPLTDSST
jgi:hypothetical protein